MNLNKKIYFFDKGIFNPYRMSNVELKVNQAVKENKIFFTEDQPWEIRYDNSYPNVFYDEIAGVYRCYYSTFTDDEESEKYSLEERKVRQYRPKTSRVVSLCYAESIDGVNWEKPHLGITDFRGSKENNIIGHFLHGTSVFLDKHETDENRRYKMFTKIDYGNGVHFIAVAFSKDGIHFDEYIKVPNFNPRADTHNHIIYDEKLACYILITRTWRDSLRLPCVSTSTDFINWTPIQEILNVCDYENQIYSMPIFKRGDYVLGLASVFHEGDQLDDDYDTVDLQLTYSYRHAGWHYLNTNTPLIPRGKGKYGNGEFDCGCIYASAPVEIGNRTYFYYMGGNGQHTNFRETSLSRAYVEKDCFAYWDVKRSEHPGVLYTNGFIFLNDQVYLDAEIAEDGFVTIELFEANHTSKNITAMLEKVEENRYKIVFSEVVPRTQTRLKISFKNAKIYAIEGDLDISRIEADNTLLRS